MRDTKNAIITFDWGPDKQDRFSSILCDLDSGIQSLGRVLSERYSSSGKCETLFEALESNQESRLKAFPISKNFNQDLGISTAPTFKKSIGTLKRKVKNIDYQYLYQRGYWYVINRKGKKSLLAAELNRIQE